MLVTQTFAIKKYWMKKFAIKNWLLMALTITVFAACNAPYVSKKRGYYKIEMPERKYQLFNDPGLPYTFEYPVYAKIVQDTTYFDNNPENNFWRNIDFPTFNARVFLSYKQVGGKALYKLKQANGIYKDTIAINLFDKMVTDAFTLTNKNDVVANSIKDSVIKTTNGISGIFFKVGGNAATAKQFFLTDTSKNFIRGALYFDVTPNADSLKPVQDFLQVDLEHLINTFKWKNIN
jgi:gliding motility-associated lipoprotein GldD